MKIIILTLSLLFCLSVPAYSQTIGDQFTAGRAQLAVDLAKRSDLATIARPAIEKKYNDLLWEQQQYEKYVTLHNKKAEEHTQHLQAHDAAAAQHNANQCYYPEGNPGACSAYNAESSRLNTEGASLDSERDAINQEKDSLDQIRDGITSGSLEYAALAKKFNAEYQDNEDDIARLTKILDGIQQQYQNCVDALKGSSLEKIHEVCGQMFDGNGTHDGLTTTGTGNTNMR
jgi:chromosome segregation ATPase